MPRAVIDILYESPLWKPVLRGAKKKLVTEVVEAALAGSAKRHASVTVLLTDDAHMRKLNHDFRGKDKATNVLSFASSFQGEDFFLGDLALGFETIKREAKAQGKRFEDHLAHMLVHGTLHLLGHDHQGKREAQRMEKIEIQVLKKLGIADPYVI